MKRTNVVIDEKKLNEAKRVLDLHTTKEVIDAALIELLKMHQRKNILNLQGKIKIDLDLNRSRKTDLR